MRRQDKAKNMTKVNILAEQRFRDKSSLNMNDGTNTENINEFFGLSKKEKWASAEKRALTHLAKIKKTPEDFGDKWKYIIAAMAQRGFKFAMFKQSSGGYVGIGKSGNGEGSNGSTVLTKEILDKEWGEFMG